LAAAAATDLFDRLRQSTAAIAKGAEARTPPA
jgi:hypothetical protein